MKILLPSVIAVLLLGFGVRSFDRPVALETVAETTANVSLGDLNGDGNLDIVLAKGRHWPLPDLVLFGDGKGHFKPGPLLPNAPDRSYSAPLADLNGDGTLDMVISNDSPDPKVVLLNDGKGRFTAAGTFGDAKWPTRNVVLADFKATGHRISRWRIDRSELSLLQRRQGAIRVQAARSGDVRNDTGGRYGWQWIEGRGGCLPRRLPERGLPQRWEGKFSGEATVRTAKGIHARDCDSGFRRRWTSGYRGMS